MKQDQVEVLQETRPIILAKEILICKKPLHDHEWKLKDNFNLERAKFLIKSFEASGSARQIALEL